MTRYGLGCPKKGEVRDKTDTIPEVTPVMCVPGN